MGKIDDITFLKIYWIDNYQQKIRFLTFTHIS